MIPKSLPFLLLLGACGGVHSAQWESVVPEPSYTVEMDAGSIKRAGDISWAWHREAYPAERMDNEGEFSFSQIKAQVQYNCALRTMMLMRAVYYNDQGTEVRNINRAGLESATSVVPDTVEERLLERACRPAKPKLAKADPARKGSAKAGAGGGKLVKVKATTDSSSSAGASNGAEEATSEGDTSPGRVGDLKGVNAKLNETKTAEAEESKTEPEPGKAVEKGAADSNEPKLDAAKPAETMHRGAKVEKATDKQHDHAQWSYEGKTGPDAWAKLDPEWSACGTGKRQAPIDIRDSVRLDLDNIKFEYKPSPLKIIDTGHTVQVTYVPGSILSLNGQQYELTNFHFHRPAEEKVNGRSFDMAAHLVHKNKDGKLAVVTVLMQAAGENPFIRTLWTHLPLDTGVDVSIPTVSVDLNQFLPRSKGYFVYSGSLTTPPCTEGVLWVVLRSPVQVSRQQIGVFTKLYKNNARPIQNANGRLIKESL